MDGTKVKKLKYNPHNNNNGMKNHKGLNQGSLAHGMGDNGHE